MLRSIAFAGRSLVMSTSLALQHFLPLAVSKTTPKPSKNPKTLNTQYQSHSKYPPEKVSIVVSQEAEEKLELEVF
jgi:hypothetical protein